jgi:hypothetical protein
MVIKHRGCINNVPLPAMSQHLAKKAKHYKKNAAEHGKAQKRDGKAKAIIPHRDVL